MKRNKINILALTKINSNVVKTRILFYTIQDLKVVEIKNSHVLKSINQQG